MMNHCMYVRVCVYVRAYGRLMDRDAILEPMHREYYVIIGCKIQDEI
jgi:hypothetical protein